MKLFALVDILTDGKRYKAGTTFEVSELTAKTLVRYGWAEVVEEVKAPKRTTRAKK